MYDEKLSISKKLKLICFIVEFFHMLLYIARYRPNPPSKPACVLVLLPPRHTNRRCCTLKILWKGAPAPSSILKIVTMDIKLFLLDLINYIEKDLLD